MQKRHTPAGGSLGAGSGPNINGSMRNAGSIVPPGYVRTIRELIFYEYARIISMSSLKGSVDYAFVSNRFKALQTGTLTIPTLNREWKQEQNIPMECIFCGAKDVLLVDHLIQLNRGGTDNSDNTFLSCPSCLTSRNRRNLFQWLGPMGKDRLHRLVLGSYLKQLFDLHSRKGSLELHKNALGLLCPLCLNASACRELNTFEELTCLCLESAFF